MTISLPLNVFLRPMLADFTNDVPRLLAKPPTENKEERSCASLELSPMLVINALPRKLCQFQFYCTLLYAY